MELRTLFQTLLPVELQVPSHITRRLLASLGYYRFRTWVAAHGDAVPDSRLYQPLYSPWEGEQAFENIYRRLQSLTLVSRERCYILWRTLQQSVHLQGDFVERVVNGERTPCAVLSQAFASNVEWAVVAHQAYSAAIRVLQDGALVPTDAEAERTRADEATTRADAERARANAASARVAELEAKLRELEGAPTPR